MSIQRGTVFDEIVSDSLAVESSAQFLEWYDSPAFDRAYDLGAEQSHWVTWNAALRSRVSPETVEKAVSKARRRLHRHDGHCINNCRRVQPTDAEVAADIIEAITTKVND